MKTLRIIFAFMVASWGYLYACTLCGGLTQSVHVSIDESHTAESMKLDIQWDFTKQFSAETLLDNDENGNKTLEANEIANIHQMIIEYLQGENYLTYIKYVPSVEAYDEMDYLPHTASNTKTEFNDNLLRFSYTLDTNLTPIDGHQLYITFFDMGAFFSFKIDKIEQELPRDKNSTVLLDNSASFELTPNQTKPQASIPSFASQNDSTPPQEGILGWMAEQLETTKNKLVSLLEDIKANQNPSSYFWLLLFSLLYGIIHAMGPGHGKSLVAAYFLGNNRSVTKALSVSALIGVVHTFSAFLLTFTIYYVIETYMGKHFGDIESITTKVSAVIIILIALYLLYKRIPKRPKTSAWSATKPNTPHEHSCGCGTCQSHSTDIGVILSAGIVPCPGTVTIFIFTLSLGVYMVGLLSAIFMSIGMSLVIFVAAYLSLKMRANTSPNARIRQILDYGSLLFIFGLGVVLFLVA